MTDPIWAPTPLPDPVVPDALIAYVNSRLPTDWGSGVTIDVSDLEAEARRVGCSWNQLYVYEIQRIFKARRWWVTFPGNYADWVPVKHIEFTPGLA